ncbi:DNA replication complex GINS psf2 [Cordyceps militaris]|uniref:DNA replication complex GINS psf2 n=1 Tax=Cordyceps militaris TaxID=73501 RepID=A0A2H4SER6_CORMI|nr:DNA replication complex GINS psf2 [Cordyceps militaris]
MASAEKQRLCLPTGVVPRTPKASESQISQGPYRVHFVKRHVKCDEVKPSCDRCLKWSGVCGGYDPPWSRSNAPRTILTCSETETQSKPIAAMCDQKNSPISSPSESAVAPSVAGAEPATPPHPHAYQPLGYSQGQYAMSSSDGSSVGSSLMTDWNILPTTAINTVDEIGILDAAFWTDTVPRLVNENLAVHYANMAVHILIGCKQRVSPLCEPPGSGNDQYSLALAHYGTALKQMRDSSEICGGTRAAILCSMLFAVFESLNGDREAAEAHLLCGQRMLNELQLLLPIGVAATSSGSVRKELPNLLGCIVLQLRTGGATYWKSQCDTLCAEYLEETVAASQYDTSTGFGQLEDYDSMTWPGDDGISAIWMNDLMC